MNDIQGQQVIHTISKIVEWLIYFSSIFIIFFIGIYHFVPASNSDAIEGVFWAEAALQSGRPLKPGFVYPYAIPFGANLFMLPFVAVFGIGTLANSLGMFLFYIVLISIVFWFFNSLTHYAKYALIGTAVFALSFRSGMGQNLSQHILYYQLGLVCFLGIISACFRIIDKRTISRSSVIILLLFSAWAGANGIVSIILSIVPVFFSFGAIYFFHKNIETKILLKITGTILGGTIIGFALYKLAMVHITESGYITQCGSYCFLSVKEWVENIQSIPEGFISLMITKNPNGANVYSLKGLETCYSIGNIVINGIIPVIYLIKIRQLSKKELLLLYSGIIIWLICLVQYVFFRGAETRLLYNGAFISFIMFGSALVLHMPEGRKIRLVFSIYMLASVIFVGAFVGTANWESDTSITDKLEEKGLDNGFATYWNANINTALSKNKVKTREIILRDGQLFHHAYNNDYSWYQKEDSSDFFILLSPDEYDNVISADNQILTTEKKDELEISGYHVFVYSADQWDKIYLSN